LSASSTFVSSHLSRFFYIFYYYSPFLFSSYCYRPNRDLHSFPTRRSSDLLTPLEFDFPVLVSDGDFCNTFHFVFPPATISLPSRSEEHTSELQSRFDLVCRLLLEKKKSYRIRKD